MLKKVLSKRISLDIFRKKKGKGKGRSSSTEQERGGETIIFLFLFIRCPFERNIWYWVKELGHFFISAFAYGTY